MKLFVLIFPIIGLLLIFIPAKITLTLDKTRNQLLFIRVSLFKKSQETYPLDQISNVTIQESRNSKGNIMYRVVFELKDHTIIPITTAYDSMLVSKLKLANQVSSFLNLENDNNLKKENIKIAYSIGAFILFGLIAIFIIIILS